MTETPASEQVERRHRGQLLALGAIALEMHQAGELDEELLMQLAAQAAETERELDQLRGPGD